MLLARNRPYPMVIASGILLAAAFPPVPLPFLACIAFVPLMLVIFQTPEKVFEDRFWGNVRAAFVILWRFITLQFIWRYRQKPWKVQRKIISHYAQVFRYAYTTFVIWNFGVSYWLMMTAFGAESAAEVLTYLSSGLVANLVNPFLMTIPVYCYARLRFTPYHRFAPSAFIFLWITFEWLHFNWDLSWSWLTLGHAFSLWPLAIQYMEFTGVLGVSFVVLLVNVLVYQAVMAPSRGQKWSFGVAAGVVFLLPFLLNIWILHPERKVFSPSGTVNVRVIQPNIDPYQKFQRSTRVQQIAIFDTLIRKPGIDTIDLVVMPETCLPDYYFPEELRRKPLLEPLWKTVYEHEFALLTGFMELRYFDALDEVPASAYRRIDNGYFDVCNSSTLMQKEPGTPQTFQKAKLVPMVERMPFLDKLSFLNKWNISLAGSLGGYGLPDSSRNFVTQNGIKIGSLVCYESEYGDYVREFVGKGAEVITIITNDGWWGNTSGHIQHAHFATLRAIETRRDIARSANTGISLFADNHGRIYQKTRWWTADVIDRKLNRYEATTFYVRHGDYLGRISLGISLICIAGFVVFGIRERQKRKAMPKD